MDDFDDLHMTKEGAMRAMHMGEKVTHRHFTIDEWMTEDRGEYRFEDGVCCTFKEFWQIRDGESWDEGWKIYK